VHIQKLTERLYSRSFLTKQYPAIKKANPNTPILLREAAGTLPKVYARFGTFSENEKGIEKEEEDLDIC
jgi:hypothetical protein